MSQTIHLAPGETLTVIADGAPTPPPDPSPYPYPVPVTSVLCTATDTRKHTARGFGVTTTAMTLAVTGADPGASYGAWGYAHEPSGHIDYSQIPDPEAVADAYGKATMTIDVNVAAPEWEIYIYRLPGSPSRTAVAICDADVVP